MRILRLRNIFGKQFLRAVVVVLVGGVCVSSHAVGATLFPAGLPAAKWSEFNAVGYTRPVTGIIYRGDPRPPSGMPLGGVATGCLDLETAGTLGLSSIFNHLTPRGGPINTPILGISVGGRTWVLTTGQTKNYIGTGREPSEFGPDLALEGVEKARSIDYWGHYPIADLEYQTDAPVSVGLRAWAPFIPGDVADSNIPGAVFEVRLRNHTQSRHTGTIAFSFPGFDSHKTKRDRKGPVWVGAPNPSRPNLPSHNIVRKALSGTPAGVWVNDLNWKMSYVLAVIGDDKIRTGGELGTDGRKWSSIQNRLPNTAPETGGASLAVDFDLKPREEKVVRYVLAWYAPEWNGGGRPDTGGNSYTHMYAKYYPDAVAVAKRLVKDHQKLLKRIIRWQEEVYNSPELPGWLADSLINNLHMITRTGIWAQAKPPIGDWCKPEDGIYALNESPRGCSQMDTSPNSAVGTLPLVYLFPELERSTLRAVKAYQFPDGRPPWNLGGCCARFADGIACGTGYWELVEPGRGWQSVTNGPNHMIRLDRYYLVTQDDKFFKEFYDSAKRNMEWTMNLRPNYGLSQIAAMPTQNTDTGEGPEDTEWFEDLPYYGYVSHAGGLRMAQARMMRRWAEKMRDVEYAKNLDAVLKAGADALEQYLWNGSYYLCYHEPETGRRRDAIFTIQLDGQYFARSHGLAGAFPEDRVATVLQTIKDKGCTVGDLGIPPNYVSPEGTAIKDIGGYGTYNYVNFTVYYLAMAYMYEGQREFGLDLLRKCQEVYSCRFAYTWDGRQALNAETGSPGLGTDYYMIMCLWGAPAAVLGQDISAPCKPGGLVYRMIQAGKR